MNKKIIYGLIACVVASAAVASPPAGDYLGIVVITDSVGDISGAIPVGQDKTEAQCYDRLYSNMEQHADGIAKFLSEGDSVVPYCIDIKHAKHGKQIDPPNGKDELNKKDVDPAQLAKPRVST